MAFDPRRVVVDDLNGDVGMKMRDNLRGHFLVQLHHRRLVYLRRSRQQVRRLADESGAERDGKSLKNAFLSKFCVGPNHENTIIAQT